MEKLNKLEDIDYSNPMTMINNMQTLVRLAQISIKSDMKEWDIAVEMRDISAKMKENAEALDALYCMEGGNAEAIDYQIRYLEELIERNLCTCGEYKTGFMNECTPECEDGPSELEVKREIEYLKLVSKLRRQYGK